MKALRMMRNIAALCIVAIAVASSFGDPSQAKWVCDRNTNACCCHKRHTTLPPTDPMFLICSSYCISPHGFPLTAWNDFVAAFTWV